MLAWEWTLEKARDGEGEVEKKAATRKISQTAQVWRQCFFYVLFTVTHNKIDVHECFSGHLRPQSWLQPSAYRYHRNGSIKRTSGIHFPVSAQFFLLFLFNNYMYFTYCFFFSCSLWLSSWLRTTTTPGAGRRRWSCSLKVKYFTFLRFLAVAFFIFFINWALK